MTKSLFFGCSVAVLSCPAFAQSSVTLYGSVDVGVDYVTNSRGGHLIQESAGKRTPDRFGFRIVEDLGGGNKVVVRLENGFLTNTGAQINPQSFFNRNAQIGLTNDTFGTISAGHIPDYVYEYVGALNNSVPGISSFYTVGNLDGLANTHAMDNSVKYDTPVFYGFQAGVMNGFGGQAGDFSAGRQYSIGARYQQGRFKFGAAYTMSHDRTADVFGVFSLSSLLGQPLRAGTMFNASRYSTIAVGGSVVIGAFTPHATFTSVKLANQNGAKSERNYQAGVNIDLSGGERICLLGVSYNRSLFEDLTFNQYNLFMTYYLSKSTQVYAGAGLQRASGPNAKAAQFGYQASSSSNQTVARIGINHMF
ncbi:Outer membrane protein (porin) [Caballeronia glathei]|uniref:Porin n=1 Tax=Caballeronia glathei TaxID=60547 RepID=A0A069PWL1_9BURK|nr:MULTISPECIES: porin [Burkholderiaceae]KDR44204.1 porin [Caballeronia glathei]TCK34645.1 putative porin [Paraburkholderia sp. BL8N3]CDY77483.1 Outer membrane protein (porin) [Caballeronia glathei]